MYARAAWAALIALLISLLGAVPAQAAGVVVGPVTVTAQPADVTVVAGADATFTVVAEDANGDPVPVTRWETDHSPNFSWVTVPDSAGLGTLTVASTWADDGYRFRALVDDGAGGLLASDPATLLVHWAPEVQLLSPTAQTLDRGVSFTLAANGWSNPTASVRWQRAVAADGPWTDVPGATSIGYSGTAPEAALTTDYYRAVYTNDVGSGISPVASITSTAYHPSPSAVPSVSVSNPLPNQMTVTWTAPTTTGSLSGYVVRVLRLDGSQAAQRSTSALTESFTLPSGGYYATVASVGEAGEVGPTVSSSLTVSSLIRTGTVSGTVLRPYRDGFQDAVTLRATSSFAASGSVRVLNASGAVVRTFALGTGTSWSSTFDGRTSGGSALPFGTYRAQFVLGGAVYVTRTLSIASSQVATPVRRWSLSQVFPAADGYRDSARLSVTTNVPATVSIVVTGAKGKAKKKVFGKASFSRRTSSSYLWNGRYRGKAAPAGTYRAKVTVRGGEGGARVAYATISVSSKRRTAKSFTVTVKAASALDAMALGTFSAGSDVGGQQLWGCSFAGCDPDVGLYSAALPSSVSGYAAVRIAVCVRGTSGFPAGRFSYTTPQRGLTGALYGFGAGAQVCYRARDAPGNAFAGRTVHWLTANVDQGSTSSIDLAYFTVTGTRYVLT